MAESNWVTGSASESHALNSTDYEKNNLVLVEGVQDMVVNAPIISLYNDRIRPLLDGIDKLRNLMVMKEGIQLPTIVVVGDQSSGKSSVLESLAGIDLPRGQGICTRVPLIMRLQNHATPTPEIFLEFNGKEVHIDEAHIADAINRATDEIAGNSKGISDIPLTLFVKKNGVPDLTMIDLPGITRVPVHGQPENIYEQITNIIREYIRPEESIILNVLSATVDFPTCESIRMSQQVDKTRKRTLGVVTKVDKAPEGLLEKVTADDVNIGLGYVCVRNRIGDESYEEARKEEARLFKTHPLLSQIDKSIVGIPVLAQKLVKIQADSISKSLPEIVKKIDEKLNSNLSELNKMPKILSSDAEAMTTLMHIIGAARDTLKKILLRGELDEYPDDRHMHGAARLVEMLNQCSDELQKCDEIDLPRNFLTEEIRILEESKGIKLPNFLPHSAFLALWQKKVNGISNIPVEFTEKVWNYIEDIFISVLMDHSANYYKLQLFARRAGHNLIAKMKEQSVNRVMEIVQMEKLTDYTCNPEYMSEWNKLMTKQTDFINNVLAGYSKIHLQGIGDIEVGHLRKNPRVVDQAFDLKMRMIAYWKIVLRRLVDCMALHLQFSIHNLLNKEMEMEIFKELMDPYGGAIGRMLGDSPSVAAKRLKLNRSIELLRQSKEVVAEITHRIAGYDDKASLDDGSFPFTF